MAAENSAPTMKKPERPQRTLGGVGGQQEQQAEDEDDEDAQGLELPGEVGLGALFDGSADLLHLLGAGVGRQDLPAEERHP